jgi:hypothetical protein
MRRAGAARGAALFVALGLLLVGLGVAAVLVLRTPAGEVPLAVPTPAPSPTSTAPPTEPLTGRALSDPTLLKRPAVAVKVSNVRTAHPQVGIDRADIVFCEPIGVSYTRLAAIFHSEIPAAVGPVRSVRPMDAPILSPLTPVFAHTMAAPWVMTYLETTTTVESLGSLQVPLATGAYQVDPARPAPDHVLVDPSVLLDLSRTAQPPAPYFGYARTASDASAALGRRATSITVPYGPSWDVAWSYDRDSGRYLRDEAWGPHVSADGARVAATNVLILRADSVVEKLAAGEGAAVPVVQLIDSSGPLVAFTGGSFVRGRWAKGDVDEPFVLTTRDGGPLLLAPGNTWVELPATNAAVSFS